MEKVLQLKNKSKTVGSIKMQNYSDAANLYFYGDICSSEWDCEPEDKCPQDIANFLNEIDSNKPINIYINSGGGSVFAGIAIYNQLRRHKAHKTVYIDGLAASIASVIALAGDTVIIHSNSQFMIHKPWTMGAGDAEDLRKVADSLDKCEQSILNIYEEHLKESVSIDTIKEMVAKETWLTGAEASNYFNMQLEKECELVACTSQYFDKYKHKLCSNLALTINNDDLELRLRILKASL